MRYPLRGVPVVRVVVFRRLDNEGNLGLGLRVLKLTQIAVRPLTYESVDF